jgi:TolA-binding protein
MPLVGVEPRASTNSAGATPATVPIGTPEATPEEPAAAVMHAKRPGPGRARPPQDPPGARASSRDPVEVVATSSSTLAAEVSRIDTARTANASGDYDEAMRVIERYHRDFPQGALAPDADVVALEAVAAKHDHDEIARRAALFLSRYPGDPHAARVKWLAEH